ncbi:MAG: DPP IV N-terminal domain-containing protein [Polyangiaceae bacterium]
MHPAVVDATTVASKPSAPPPVDTTFLETFAKTRGFRLGTPVSPTPTPDGKSVLFLRSGPRDPKQSLFEMDVASGAVREIVSPDALLASPETLSPAERARRERMRISAGGIATFELSKDGATILFALSGRLFVHERATSKTRELPLGKGSIFDPHFSPDGTKVAFVRENDLFVSSVRKPSASRVTRGGSETLTHGMAEFIAQEELDRFRGYTFSPDGTELLYEEADTSKVEKLTIADPSRPEREPDRPAYPRPGKANADVRFGIVKTSGGATRWITWDRERYPYVASFAWHEGAPPTLFVLDRLQRVGELLAVDPKSGATKVLAHEEDPSWINVDPSMPKWVGTSGEFLWTSERSGRLALELRNTKGDVVRTLVSGDEGYQGIAHVDASSRSAWVHASKEPTETHLTKVSLDDASKSPVFPETSGTSVRATFREGARTFVTYDSSAKAWPKRHVRSLDTKDVRELPSVAEVPPRLADVRFESMGKDAVRVAIVSPSTASGDRPGTKRPILDAAYAGPHHQQVVTDVARYAQMQWMADATGAHVVAIDAKGTPNRGRDWERSLAGKLGEVPLDGHVETIRALVAAHPEMDGQRVGVYGWSFGGYFSALAVLARPDVFKVAMAGAPPADWRDYDTAYTERYLGLPKDKAADYDRASLLTHAAKATGEKRPLLVVHGTADDNVYFFNSLKLVDALDRSGRPYEFLPLSGVTHQLAEPTLAARVWGRVATFFRDNL